MSKKEQIAKLYEETINKVTSDADEWLKFLESAGKSYGRGFKEQILIYAQAPKATALLSFDDWNDKFHRRIRAGSKGIAVFTDDTQQKIQYYFDIKHTKATENSIEVGIWKLTSYNENSVINALNDFSATESNNLIQCVEAVTDTIIDNDATGNVQILLNEVDESLHADYKKALKASINHMVLSRCNTLDVKYKEIINNVMPLIQPDIIVMFGNIVNAASNMELVTISKEARKTHKIKEDKGYETDLHKGSGRTTVSGPGATKDGVLRGQVREYVSGLPETELSSDIRGLSDAESTGGHSEQEGRGSDGASRHADDRADGEAGRERSSERERPDALGTESQQHQEPGGGNRSAGTDLQRQIQIKEIKADSGKLPAFSVNSKQISLFDTQEYFEHNKPAIPKNVIYEAIKLGSNERESRLNIIAYYMKDKSDRDNSVFLKNLYTKNLYDIENGFGFSVDDTKYSMWYNEDGIRISEGTSALSPASTLLTWDEAAKTVKELLNVGNYASQSELSKALNHEYTSIAYSLIDIYRDIEHDKRNGLLPTIGKIYEKQRTYPDVVYETEPLLRNYETLQILIDEFGEFLDRYEENPSIMRFKYHRLHDTFDKLVDLQIEPKQFYANKGTNFKHDLYISQDEIDAVIKKSNIDGNYKLDIYSYFVNHSDADDRVKFLKKYHGEYSSSSDCNTSTTWTTKGIHYKRSAENIPEIDLSWNQVEKRLNQLITEDKFLSKTNKAAIPAYEKKYLCKEINSLYSYLTDKCPYERGNDVTDYESNLAKVSEMLDSQEGRNTLLNSMSSILATGEPYSDVENRNELIDKMLRDSIADLTAYDNNTFTLFAEKKEPIYHEDVFFITDNGIKWMYYNPDSNAGGQYVENNISFEDIIEAAKDNHLEADFFDYLGSIANQYLYDLGEDDYQDAYNAYKQTPDFIDCSSQTMNDLVELAKGHIPEKEKKPNSLTFKIPFSEHTAFYDKKLNERFTDISFALGNTLLGYLDEKQHRERQTDSDRVGWYHKTDFKIDAVIDGENFHYDGRFDIGDGEGTLIEHIKNYINYCLSSDCPYIPHWKNQGEDFYNNAIKGLERERDILLPFLEKHTELNQEDKELFDKILETESDWYRKTDIITESDASTQTEPEIVEAEIIEPVQDGDYDNSYDVGLFLDDEAVEFQEYFSEYVEENESDIFESIQPEIDKVKGLLEKEKNKEADTQSQNKVNYKITNDNLGIGTTSEKYNDNIAAIKTLKQIEAENRMATPTEQEILAKYIGWGGLSKCFEEDRSSYTELRSILTEEEFNDARASTLTSFYTPPVVIRSMYQVLENMEFKNGSILEPSCGVGNFFGMLPDSMKDSKCFGVEIDSISGRIAKQLYQDANIFIQSFENVNFPDNTFDVVIGNVPFGDFKVHDTRYQKGNFLIHDYFFAKALDKVRSGGIVMLLTSKGTMDKNSISVRRYIAERAELLGAIRLPDNTFKANAGTDVTSDILVLQKRDEIVQDVNDKWIHLGMDKNKILINSYFTEHPEMILGTMAMKSTQYGMDSTCKPCSDKSLEDLLNKAIQCISGKITERTSDVVDAEKEIQRLNEHNISDLKNYSYGFVDGKLVYKENNNIIPASDLSKNATSKVIALVKIRDCVKELIKYQLEDYPEADIKQLRERLNILHDSFIKNHGLINDKTNKKVFSKDNSYPLLCALENIDGEGNLKSKSDIFYKRTVKPKKVLTHVDTALEALHASLNYRASIDTDYMERLYGKSFDEIEQELKGVIYRVPTIITENEINSINYEFQTADEYLSGDVRKKLRVAKTAAEIDRSYQANVDILKQVLPKDLKYSEISVRLGSAWIPANDIQQFVYELLSTPNYHKDRITVQYCQQTTEWRIEGKSVDKDNIKAEKKYGTHRINAYEIIEDTLNLKSVKIFDYKTDPKTDNVIKVLNEKETAIALDKQDAIKDAFEEWIWQDSERRERLSKFYNEKYNSNVTRYYDGSHIDFPEMNPEIHLRPHQKNAVARAIYGGNTLLAHCVGAGKTFTMAATAMEKKRLGLCNKSIVVVPNHIIGKFASDWLELYPNANLLVSTEDDFKPDNRKKFCSRIATSDIDAVIIGHSQFNKIPLSIERQQKYLNDQIDEIVIGISEAKKQEGSNFTVKQLVKAQKRLEERLDKLNDQSKKDDVVTFEELGCDMMFVDEADEFKNLYTYTKIHDVGGISHSESQKASDMYMKCQYMDEITDCTGIEFATATPISNSIVECHTMKRFLARERLKELDLDYFDSWISIFGEAVTAQELAPEGSGFRPKTRFARFNNLPELLSIFREFADIQTADMLDLPVPEANERVIVAKPTEHQKDMIKNLGKRADAVRGRKVSSEIDNMLKIISEGRKIALDQRIINELLPDETGTKVNLCVDELYNIWEKTAEKHLTQLVFCDLSTPNGKKEFDVYNDIKNKLIARGIPENEIEFIHDYNTSVKKEGLFSKVRCGDVRLLFGSTSKMGAGTNVQDLIIASHDLDCPWRPRDLEQRRGRSIRQGNKNKVVDIVRYVTEGTFDAYNYQLIENKLKMINQVLSSRNPARSVEDIDEAVLSYAEIKMLATGNPLIKEKMDLDVSISKLKLQKQNFLDQKYEMEDKIRKYYPAEISKHELLINQYEQDISKRIMFAKGSDFIGMELFGQQCFDKGVAGNNILAICKSIKKSAEPIAIGKYRGFDMEISFDSYNQEYNLNIIGAKKHEITLGHDIIGNITRIDNCIDKMDEHLSDLQEKLVILKEQFEIAKKEVQNMFPHEEELTQQLQRAKEVERIINELNKEKKEQQDIPEKKKIDFDIPSDKIDLDFKNNVNQSKSVGYDI